VSTILKNILAFSSLAVGVPVVLPHRLNVNGIPALPKTVEPDVGGFVITADATNITVTRTVTGPAAVNVLVEFWHTIESVVPLVPPPGKLIGQVPWIQQPGAGGGSSGGGDPNCLIYRPGSGLLGPVVFDTWAGLIAALATLRASANGSGCYTIAFDDSIVSPCVIPPGAYDMTQVTWEPALITTTGTNVAVSIPEGVTFTKLRLFNFSLAITFTGVTPPVSDFGAFDVVGMFGGVKIGCSGTGPFFSNTVVGGPPVIFGIDRGSVIADLGFGQAVIDAPVVGAFVFIVAQSAFSELQANTVSGVVGSTLLIGTAASGIQLASETHPAFLGTLVQQNTTRARLTPTPAPPSKPVIADMTITDANAMVLVDPSGLFPVPGQLVLTLPLAASASVNRGQHVIIKNVSPLPGVITIIPQGADTIDGIALVAFNEPMGAICFVSDGVDTWRQAPTSLYAPPEQWAQENVAPSQTGVALSCQVSTNFDDLRMIRPGSIVGLGVRFTEAITAGTATIRATINGGNAAIEVVCTSLSNADGGQMTTQSGVDVYAGGSVIGVEIDTDAGITFANRSNVEVWLEVTEFGDPLLRR